MSRAKKILEATSPEDVIKREIASVNNRMKKLNSIMGHNQWQEKAGVSGSMYEEVYQLANDLLALHRAQGGRMH